MNHRTARVGQVIFTLEGFQAATENALLPRLDDERMEALVARTTTRFVEPVEECEARVEALQTAMEFGIQAGRKPECLRRRSLLVSDS